MENLFQFYTNSEFITCIFLFGVIVFHFLLRKKPSSQLYFIWLFVLIRLLMPYSLSVDWKFGEYTIPQEITGILSENDNEALHDMSNDNGLQNNVEDDNEAGNINTVNFRLCFQVIWFVGVLCFAIYYLLRMVLLNSKIKRSSKVKGYKNVWMWKDHTGACVIGLFHPRIYVPQGCTGNSLDMIVRHEVQHIKHYDYLFIYLFYCGLALHWYNPLVWMAYRMAIQDVEKACDERVLFHSTLNERQTYARVLVDFYKEASVKSVTLGFGTSDIKKRIKSIGEHKKKKRIYTVIIIVVCCICLGICSLFHVKSETQKIGYTIGKDKIGVSIPSVIYADMDKCIFYDYHGVFIYEFNDKVLSDYLPFSEIGFSSSIQGDDASFAFSEDKGRVVYITNYTKLYVYETSKQSGHLIDYSENNMPADVLDSVEVLDEQRNDSVSPIYQIDGNTKLYWTYSGNEGNYSDLFLILNKNGDIEEYAIFR